jgi:hypothetical protein
MLSRTTLGPGIGATGAAVRRVAAPTQIGRAVVKYQNSEAPTKLRGLHQVSQPANACAGATSATITSPNSTTAPMNFAGGSASHWRRLRRQGPALYGPRFTPARQHHR